MTLRLMTATFRVYCGRADMRGRHEMKPADENSLRMLECRVAYDLSCVAYPARAWVPQKTYKGKHVYDVIIIGGGQSGITLALHLRRECVNNIRIIDRNAHSREGPWRTFARMHTLRSPKHVTGPELGIPSLSVKAWWEAKYGAQSWSDMDKIPTASWAEYLAWLKRVSGVDITNNTQACDIVPLEDDVLAVHTRRTDRPCRGESESVLLARNVVLATGIEGSGQWKVPQIISDNIPKAFYAHTAGTIDFAKLSGKRVAILGAGASAFDNAAEALEHGAASVDLFVRRKKLPTVNPYRWMEYTGFLRHFADLEDKDKWRFMRYLFELNQPRPQDTCLRVTRFDNFTMHLANPVEDAGFDNGALWLQTPRRRAGFDFLIVGTGFKVDLGLRPELKSVRDRIALWADRYRPEVGDEDAGLAAFPYMTANFQFMEKHPGCAPYLRHIFSYTYGSMPSLAASAGISALKFGMERLVAGITRELFCIDADYHFNALKSFKEKELTLFDD